MRTPISTDDQPGQTGVVDHPGRLRANALNLGGAVVIALGSSAPTVSVALTLSALLAVTSYASPVAILVCGLPMLGIALAYRRLNMWRVNCGGTYMWAGRAISPYFGFLVGWMTALAYFLGVMSTVLPIGPYALQAVAPSYQNSGVAEAIVGTLALVFILVVGYIGIRTTARVQWILVGLEYTVVLILAGVAIIAVFGGNNDSAQFSWSWFSWSTLGGTSGLISGSLIAVFMYSGWDTAILTNEETEKAHITPGKAVVISVIAVAILDSLFTFIFEGAVKRGPLEAHGGNALSYIAQVLANSAIAKVVVIAVMLSALGSTLGSLVSGARVSFSMAADGVLPRILSRTHPRYKTPSAATILVFGIGVATLWLYSIGSSSVQTSFDTVISSDGLLFALFYAGTGVTVAVYYRRLAVRSMKLFLELLVVPLASTAFLLYVSWRAVPTNLGGWGSRDMEYLYGMMLVGLVLMLYARFVVRAPYFTDGRETYEPAAAASPNSEPRI